MSELTAFFAQNKIKTENKKYVASKSFINEDGSFIEWEIRKITADEDEKIRKDATRKVAVVGKRGQYRDELDTDLYLAKMCVASTVFPNLYSAELQDSYGVKTPEELLRQMLDAGEYADYKNIIVEHNGFDVSMDDLVDEAKN